MAEKESAYIVSSLKYRPQTFEDVVGQEHVSRTLRNALQRQRLANGYIFTGPRGVGKTTSARILAKAINCENPEDGNPCNVCNHCVEITAGRSIDVLEVDGASTRGIDAIRELREVVKYPPVNSNYRVYIIDEVHMLTKEAFNALLKTLEEPPPQVLFIFATTEPQKVPLTILSRCQRYDFRMISTETMVARLKMISENEGISVSDDGLGLIARKAAGSLRDSLSLLDQVSAFTEDEASLDLVRQVLGILDASIYFDMLHHVASQSAENLINQANMLFSRGISITEFLHGLSEHIRNLLVVKVAGVNQFLDVSDTDSQLLLEQCEYFEERDLLRMQNLVLETIRDQRFVSNQIVSVELMLLKLARSTRALDLDDLFSGKTGSTRKKPTPKALDLPDEPEQVTQPIAPTKTITPPVDQEPEEVTPSPEIMVEIEQEIVDQNSTPIEPENVEIHETNSEIEESIEPANPEMPLEQDAEIPPLDESNTEQNPERQIQPDEDNTQVNSTLTLEELMKSWEAFIGKLEQVGKSTGAFMSEGTAAKFENETLTINFAPEQKYHVQTLAKNIHNIEKIAAEVFGTKMTIKLLEQNGHKPKERKEDEVLGHPTSQHLLDIFDGEIIDD